MGKFLYLITGLVILGLGFYLYFGLEWSLEVIAAKLGVITAIITSLTILWKKFLGPLLNKASNHLEQVSSMIKGIEEIRKEIKPNGGTSIKDSINRIEARIINMEHVQSALRQDGPMGIFQCKINGQNIDVNRTYCRLLGCTREELLGFGWKNFLHEDGKHEYDEEWKDAFLDGREINFPTKLKSNNGKVIEAEIRAYPITDISGEVVQYLGILTPTNISLVQKSSKIII